MQIGGRFVWSVPLVFRSTSYDGDTAVYTFGAIGLQPLGDTAKMQLYLVGGDWNMTVIFPYTGHHHPN